MSFIEIFRTCLSRCGFLQQSVLRWNIEGFKYIKVVYASSFAATIAFLSSFSYWVWGHDYSNESCWSVPLHCLVWEQRGNSKESTIKNKATEQYSPVVSHFVGSVHRALVLTYGSVREILQCDNSNESYLKISIFPIMQEWDGTMCDPKTKIGFEVQHYSNRPLAQLHLVTHVTIPEFILFFLIYLNLV